jgi:glycosyltransferase involved in cell wall biosynthesis
MVLAAAAFAAQITPAMVRALNERRPFAEVDSVATPLATGSTFTEIIVHGRAGWKRGKVRKAKTDFIVFRKPGETAPAEPLIALAIELNAFAVAKQIAWTGWRPRVATKHPFRRLLPGEVSQIEMPFSSLIVLRRDAMKSTHAVTFGAALMSMCECAPCFVAGDEGPMTQEPAMPLEDLEHVLRSARSPRRRSLLQRGNVVFAPSFAQPFRALKRVLIVSPYLPFPLSHGGAVRIYNICKSLAGEIDFVLLCFREVTETVRYPELHRVFREVYTVDIDEKSNDTSAPKQVVDYRNSAMSALIREQARRVDIVQLEFTQIAEYRFCAEGRPTILVEHDITFTLYQQLGRDFELWERFESQALRSVDMTWTMSERDRALAIEHGAGKTLAIPNGVDLQRFRPQRRETEGLAILFVGSFRHLPNLLAFEAMRESIMPVVWQRFPDCLLHVIAGPDHEKWARSGGKGKLLAPDARITIQGFVEDVRPAYRECDVVAIPLPVSAGTNIKLMEAMACGRAIVSTPVGCVGLELEDGADLLVSDLAGFGAAICRLLENGLMRERIAARARATAEEHFDWDIIARGALECYRGLEKRP